MTIILLTTNFVNYQQNARHKGKVKVQPSGITVHSINGMHCHNEQNKIIILMMVNTSMNSYIGQGCIKSDATETVTKIEQVTSNCINAMVIKTSSSQNACSGNSALGIRGCWGMSQGMRAESGQFASRVARL